jgi:hypothetical protein
MIVLVNFPRVHFPGAGKGVRVRVQGLPEEIGLELE